MKLFFLGLLISFFYSLLILPENEGSKPAINPTIPPLLYNGMVIIPYNKVNAIHIHHWIYMLIACLLGLFFKISKVFIGFSLGLILNGIMYKDCFKFIVSNPYN